MANKLEKQRRLQQKLLEEANKLQKLNQTIFHVSYCTLLLILKILTSQCILFPLRVRKGDQSQPEAKLFTSLAAVSCTP